MTAKHTLIAAALFFLSSAQIAQAQLPPDAVKLDRLKIPETETASELCPVHLVASDPSLPMWTHEGVQYRGHTPECQAEFEADPAAYVEAAREQRYVNNFMGVMSRIWCPVTDEISPGGLTEWERDGLVWESCCDFCDGSVVEEDFEDARERLIVRAQKAYGMTGGKYTEGAESPVEGAIDFGDGLPPLEGEEHDHGAHDHGDAMEVASAPEPDYIAGRTLEATYAGGVGELFENRCVECHKPGGLAPMSFTTRGKIRKWAKSLKESVNTRGMPPWPAAQGAVHFSNSRYLADSELALLNDWIAAGYPAGEGTYASAAASGGEWAIGEPDHVFDVSGYTLGADETAKVVEVEVATSFPEDRWIAAAEAKPGDEYTIFGIDAGPLGSYYPGGEIDVLSGGFGRLLPAGQAVTVRLTNAKENGYELPVPASRLAVKFVDGDDNSVGDIGKTVKLDPLSNRHFTIPAGIEDFEATASYVFAYDSKIHAFRPILNARGKSVQITAISPEGTETLLLDIPRWNPDYKLRYALSEPFAVSSGTKVVLRAIYDNSKLNARNPDASVEVPAGAGGEVLEGRMEYSFIR